MDEKSRIELRVCSALLTANRRELEWAVSQSSEVIGVEIFELSKAALNNAPIPGTHGLVNATNYLPSWAQYIGQRAVLLFPRLARRILRSSGLHHQMF